MIGSDQRRISQDLKRVGYTKITLKHGKDGRSIKSEQGYEKFVPASNHDLCREFIQYYKHVDQIRPFLEEILGTPDKNI